MALFKIFKGKDETKMPANTIEGYAYFAEDTGNFFVDLKTEEYESHEQAIEDEGRKQLNAHIADYSNEAGHVTSKLIFGKKEFDGRVEKEIVITDLVEIDDYLLRSGDKPMTGTFQAMNIKPIETEIYSIGDEDNRWVNVYMQNTRTDKIILSAESYGVEFPDFPEEGQVFFKELEYDIIDTENCIEKLDKDFLRYQPTGALNPSTGDIISDCLYVVNGSIVNGASEEQGLLLNIDSIDNPYQISIFDQKDDYIYKRDFKNGDWSNWRKMSAGYADLAKEAKLAFLANEATHTIQSDEAIHANLADEATHASWTHEAIHAQRADEAIHSSETTHSETADEAKITRYISSLDTRNDLIKPSSLSARQGVQFNFKGKSATGLNEYAGIMTYRPYSSGSNWTGGPAHEIGFMSSGLKHRQSTGDSSWGDWEYIITASSQNDVWRSNGAIWNGGANVECSGVNTEWSFNVSETGSGNSFWHVWSGNLEKSMISCYPKDGHVKIHDTLIVDAHVGNYGEGIRLTGQDGQQITIALGAQSDAPGGGTNENCWSIHRKSDNNFAISKASSDGINGLVMTETGMGLGTTNPQKRLHVVGSVYADGEWLRSSGNTGYYNESYGGGIWMNDSYYLRVYGGKHFIGEGEIISTSANAFRAVYGNNSVILRNDGGSFYMLLSKAQEAGDNWRNDLPGGHPFRIDLSTGYIYTSRTYGSVWNDYAEYRESEVLEPGKCVIENGDDTMSLSSERLQRGAEIISDTFGYAIGETETAKTPIAVAGRVLAYGYEDREEFKKHIGWPVCSGPNGTISIMTEEEETKYPSRIIGFISAVPDYEEWGSGNVKVNNRIWIRIK